MELFQQLLQEHGPSMWLYILIPFLLGFLLARLLVLPTLREERKHSQNTMKLYLTAEKKCQKAEEQAGELSEEVQECRERMKGKDQLVAAWRAEAESCERMLHQYEQKLESLQQQLAERENILLEALREEENRNLSFKRVEERMKALEEENRQLIHQLSTEQVALEQIARMQSTLNAALQRIADLESTLLDQMKAGKNTDVQTAALQPDAENGEDVETKLKLPAKELLPEDSTERAKVHIKKAIGSSIPPAQTQDQLTLIQGIGPFIEAQLNELGICTFEQIAALSNQHIEWLTQAIRFIPGRIKKDRWVEQAKELALRTKEAKKKKSKKKKKATSKHRSANQRDDLKLIEGIGPKIEKVLNKAGIKTWRQLADQSPEELQRILAAAGKRFVMHQPHSWPEQANRLAEGKA